jgi:hypothetical protein
MRMFLQLFKILIISTLELKVMASNIYHIINISKLGFWISASNNLTLPIGETISLRLCHGVKKPFISYIWYLENSPLNCM